MINARKWSSYRMVKNGVAQDFVGQTFIRNINTNTTDLMDDAERDKTLELVFADVKFLTRTSEKKSCWEPQYDDTDKPV